MSLTPSFLAALRVSQVPEYRLAVEVDLDPTLLSKLVHGARVIRPQHVPKLDAIARRLGLPKGVSARGDHRRPR